MRNYNAESTTEFQILFERHNLLFDMLIYCTRIQERGKEPLFTTNQRILINQERGALLSQMSALTDGIYDNVRFFEVPQIIENLIQSNKSKI